jgi:MATE family multidrug resistance protein
MAGRSTEAAPRGGDVRDTARLAIPLVIAHMAVMTMGLVDTAFVGRTSAIELGAVGLGSVLSYAILTLGSGAPLALEPLISQALGAGSPERAAAWWRAGARVTLLGSIPVAALTVLVVANVTLAGVDPTLRDHTLAYTLARLPASAFFLLYLACRSYLQAAGDTRSLLVSAVLANVVNAAADAVLVMGDRALVAIGLPAVGLPALGGVGAGIATTLSGAFMLLWLLPAIRRQTRVQEVVAIPGATRTILRIGTPVGAQTFAETGAFSVVGVLAGVLSAEVAAAHQIALQISSFTFMAALGIGGATGVRVGRAVGAGDGPGARRAGVVGGWFVMALMGTCALAFLTIPEPLVSLFTDDAMLIAAATPLLRIAAAFQLFDGLQVVMAGALRGAGDVKVPLAATLLAHWLVGIPVAWWLSIHAGLGAAGLWYGLTAALVTIGIGLTFRFLRLTGRPIQRLADDERLPAPASP